MVDPHHADMTTTTLARPAAPARQPAVLAAIAGAVSAAVALGLSELLAGILPGSTSLVAAVGQVIIDNQPPGAKDLVVALFGTNDKLAFELIIVAIALAIGAGLGVLGRRQFGVAAIVFGAFGLLGFAASLNDPLANPGIAAASAAISVGAGLWVLGWLLGPSRGAPAAALAGGTAGQVGGATMPDWSRRSFIIRAGTVTSAAVVAGFAGRQLLERQRVAPVGAGSAVPP